ncbi:hypothetical protein [Yoonia sp.]|uniref:hypothetical protein n=1 Tax=Yoonia sp. TaxID=2212373 RepID=UPI002FD99D27
MADSYVERVAGEIADLAIADEIASGDITIVDKIAKVLGSSSQTLEEAFLTAVRVRKAEARARAMLEKRAQTGYADVTVETPSAEDAPAEDVAIELPAITTPQKSDTATEPQDVAPEPAKSPDDDGKAATDEALDKLKRAGIGMPRRVQR